MRDTDQSKKKYISDVTPALRPSLPAMCRKRIFCQGQALSGRFADLDIHIRASGLKYSRATDEDASGGGSVKGYSHFRYRKAKYLPAVSMSLALKYMLQIIKILLTFTPHTQDFAQSIS